MAQNQNQKTYSFLNNNDYFTIPTINLKYIPQETQQETNDVLNFDEFQRLKHYKNKIDDLEDTNQWDDAKKLSNLYELIYLPNKKQKCDSISKYEPLSRSYFKLWEIINDFKLLDKECDLNFASIAEGPGGFIEAIINYRKKYTFSDKLHAITLKSVNKDIPGWNKATNFLRKNPNVVITYGSDDTGNIYNIDNIKHFRKNFKSNAYLVTADGGFDFSFNFNKQEQMSYRIIFCEIVMALSVQQKGGNFVCKFFDMYTKITMSFIYLLLSFYNEVHITKPSTSRPANSEKYIVCKGFKGIDESYLQKLFIIIKSWEYFENNNLEIQGIFDIDNKLFFNKMKEFNTKYFNIQVNNIDKTLNYINCPLNESSKKKQIKKQVSAAFTWCKTYRCKINYNSSYLS
jgi:23S rRNA U2552 (ribose-2'-O)-methylase RlmE/FtsJ